MAGGRSGTRAGRPRSGRPSTGPGRPASPSVASATDTGACDPRHGKGRPPHHAGAAGLVVLRKGWMPAGSRRRAARCNARQPGPAQRDAPRINDPTACCLPCRSSRYTAQTMPASRRSRVSMIESVCDSLTRCLCSGALSPGLRKNHHRSSFHLIVHGPSARRTNHSLARSAPHADLWVCHWTACVADNYCLAAS